MSEQENLLRDEMEQYLFGPEAENNAKNLNDAVTAKAKLKELGVDVSPQLQTQIDELESKNPLNTLPKLETRNEWIKVLESRKDKLQKAIDGLGDIKPAMREELQAELARIDEKLVEPKEELGGVSRAEYAKKVTKVLGLEDAAESKPERTLTPEQAEQLLSILEERFNANRERHDIDWVRVKSSLEANPEALWSINELEKAGHDPDVYFADDKGFDIGSCSKESPSQGRSNYSNYYESVKTRKAMGELVHHITEKQYKEQLQAKGVFDRISRSWLDTTHAYFKEIDGALVGERHHDEVVVSVDCTHSHRVNTGWRGSLRVLWS